MTARLAWAAAWLLAAGGLGATNELSEAQLEGRHLARQLRELKPAEDSLLTGVIKIRESRSKRTEFPVQFETTVTETNWKTTYSARGTNKGNASTVTILRAADQPSQYQVWLLSRPSEQTNEFNVLTGNEAMIPFAGSDFWLADLGLEFLHWPEQKLLKKELRKGQSCYVLESLNLRPATNGYARVVSWIDMDSGGIIHADAYDANRKLLKQFDPQKIKKVNGQWQLREMEMYNARSGSRTRIEFDLDAK